MYNEFGKKPKFTLVTVIAVAVVMLVAATIEMAITGYAFAYNRNQATSAANDCGNGQVPTNIGCQNTDSQIEGDENSVALTSPQTFPSITREPAGFTIEGTGEATTGEGEGQTFTCKPGSVIVPDITLDLLFSAHSDGTMSGTYTLTATIPDLPETPVFEGVFTDGTTDGRTFSLTGEGDGGICAALTSVVDVTISGDCGDEVTIKYDDEFASGTFTGNVECST
jgi:hypothetical protein